MSWPAHQILQHLEEVGTVVSSQEISTATGLAMTQIYMSADVLAKNKLLIREGRGAYAITEAGRRAIADGKWRKAGPRGPQSKQRLTCRQRLWNALRIERKGTIGHFVSLILCDGENETRITNNAETYFSILCRAGYIVRLPGREQGTAPSSRGHVRFLLADDTGAKAPRYNTQTMEVYDPNTGKTIKLTQEVPREQ